MIGLLIKLSFQTYQPLILIYRRGNFVSHLWGFTSIYQPLSYPFRFLIVTIFNTFNKPRFEPINQFVDTVETYIFDGLDDKQPIFIKTFLVLQYPVIRTNNQPDIRHPAKKVSGPTLIQITNLDQCTD